MYVDSLGARYGFLLDGWRGMEDRGSVEVVVDGGKAGSLYASLSNA